MRQEVNLQFYFIQLNKCYAGGLQEQAFGLGGEVCQEEDPAKLVKTINLTGRPVFKP